MHIEPYYSKRYQTHLCQLRALRDNRITLLSRVDSIRDAANVRFLMANLVNDPPYCATTSDPVVVIEAKLFIVL
jgi:hypothetical protein